QPGAEQCIHELPCARIEFLEIASSEIERECPAVELVRAADDGSRLSHILSGLLGIERLPDALPRQVVEVGLEDVLGGGDERETGDRVFRELVKERLDGIAAGPPLTGQSSQRRRAPQAIEHDRAVRYVIEVPRAMFQVRARLAKEEPLGKVGSTRKLELAGFGLLGIGSEAIEVLRVFGRACLHGPRIEPAEEPRVNLARLEPFGLDAGVA